MLLGFISDSLFRENSDEEIGIACPQEPSGQAPESSWVRQSQPVPQRNSKCCRVVVLIFGINKEKPRAEKHNVHSLERFRSGVVRVRNHLE